ncbi:MAG TPA: MBL fold metallo-hydrolase [Terriglobales bacterium]|nr:MBL fold metallo-hydrolase [Terriglobales bacterium]
MTNARFSVRVAVALLTPAAAQTLFLENLSKTFAYNAAAPLDVKETGVEKRAGATVHDLTYASPQGGRVPAAGDACRHRKVGDVPLQWRTLNVERGEPMRVGTKLAVVLVMLAATAAAQQQVDWEKVEIKAQPVAGGVYMLTGRGGNIGASVGEDGIVVVDDQYAPLAAKIQAALRSLSDKPVRFILNTHWHSDHTGGNADFSKLGTIVAQENVRKRLAAGGRTRFGAVEPAKPEALPIITFSERATIHLNGEDIRAIHFPHGHTDGDSVVFFTKSNVVHMGDDFFNGIFPFIDVDNGGSVQGMIANGEKILAELPDDVKIIPGHGPLAAKAELKAFIEMLRGTSGAVEAAMKQGKTLEQMKQERVLAAWDEKWGKGFLKTDDFTEILYASLTQQPAGYHNHGHAEERRAGN